MNNTDNIVKKQNKVSTFENLSKTVSLLSNDISIFLSDEIEELNVSSHVFRVGMERSLSRVLNVLVKQNQPVVIFPDSIPGLTLMVFKKTVLPNAIEMANVERSPAKEMKEAQVLDTVIARFFAKQQQKVLIIENPEVIFALFPVADTRKNLKEFEIYVTF